MARRAASLPSFDQALDEVIARAHQVEPDEVRPPVFDGAAEAQRQIAELQKKLDEAHRKLKRRELPPIAASADMTVRTHPLPAPVPQAAPRKPPWLAIGGAFAVGALAMFGAVHLRSDPPPKPPAFVMPTPVVLPLPAPLASGECSVPAPAPAPLEIRVPVGRSASETAASSAPTPRQPHPAHPAPKPAELVDPFGEAHDPRPMHTTKPAGARPAPKGEILDPFETRR